MSTTFHNTNRDVLFPSNANRNAVAKRAFKHALTRCDGDIAALELDGCANRHAPRAQNVWSFAQQVGNADSNAWLELAGDDCPGHFVRNSMDSQPNAQIGNTKCRAQVGEVDVAWPKLVVDAIVAQHEDGQASGC